jgi:hypothetical protein
VVVDVRRQAPIGFRIVVRIASQPIDNRILTFLAGELRLEGASDELSQRRLPSAGRAHGAAIELRIEKDLRSMHDVIVTIEVM